MERLTERDNYGDVYVKQHDYVTASERIAECEGFEDFEEIFRKKMTDTALERLAEYEDLEEQGRLVKLPCKVGDMVYLVCSRYSECSRYKERFEEYSCQGCEDECDSHKEYYIHINHSVSIEWIVRNLNNFGKTVFLTKEEAEQKLKELKEMESK